jgi:hypothetical protein
MNYSAVSAAGNALLARVALAFVLRLLHVVALVRRARGGFARSVVDLT